MFKAIKSMSLGVAAIPIVAAATIAAACSSVAVNGQDPPPPARTVEAGGPAAMETRPAEMYSIVLKLTDHGLETVQVDRVQNTMNRRDPHRREPTFYRVVAADGGVVFERGFRLETERRSETADENGKLSGVRVEVEEPVFTIKVPAFENLDVVRLFRAEQGRNREDAELLGEVRP